MLERKEDKTRFSPYEANPSEKVQFIVTMIEDENKFVFLIIFFFDPSKKKIIFIMYIG